VGVFFSHRYVYRKHVTNAVAHTIRILVVIASIFLVSGCQTVRGMLKPYVCDCSVDAAHACSDSDDEPSGAEAIVALTRQETRAALRDARHEVGIEDDSPTLRKLDRASQQPQRDPLELIDPTVTDAHVAPDDTSRTTTLAERFGNNLSDESHSVFAGQFSPGGEEQLAVVRAGEALQFYDVEGALARLELSGDFAPDTFEELGIEPERSAPRAIRLVRDGTLQVLLHWREEDEERGTVYKVGAFKVIGSFVGRIFVRTLATADPENGEVRRHGAYEFLHGDAHGFIRWIPADDSGQLQTDQAEILQWNRWEGVYRVPRPAPTAPKREPMQSFLAPW
jgi:hypothetical protein